MSRLKLLILIELVVAAFVGAAVWYLYAAPADAPSQARVSVPALEGQPKTASAAGGALKGAGEKFEVPSGLDVMVWDRIEDEEGAVRFRFLAPQIAAGSQAETSADDMQVLCDTYVLENLPDPAHPPHQVIVSLMEKPVELGESRPDVVQFFEVFTLEDGKCQWEMF